MSSMSSQLSTSQCKLEFSTSPTWFRTLRQLITSASMQCGFFERDAGQIAMAVDEALTNIYRHGYHGSTEGRIRLTYKTEISPHPEICIEIEDDATQIDTERIQSRDLSDIKPGGLGVHLIQTVMDKAVWEKRPEGGMKLSMSKQATSQMSSVTQSKATSNG